MVTASTGHSTKDLKARITEVEAELQRVASALPLAQRNAALAFLGGHANDDVQSVRLQMRRLEDARAGLQQLAAMSERSELKAEIERREQVCSTKAHLVSALKARSNDGNLTNEERMLAFDEHQVAKDANGGERRAIDQLADRCDEIEASFPEVFRPETV